MASRAKPISCGSWLACDAGTAVYQSRHWDAIAGKPAPTVSSGFIREMAPNPRSCGKLRGHKCRDRRDGLVCSRGAME
ncbi:hypothetical protein FPT15_05145 [Pseudomonas sp. RGB]|nr:hypothetical protein FPT15_05145 [Pseudomonas sp. RGB]